MCCMRMLIKCKLFCACFPCHARSVPNGLEIALSTLDTCLHFGFPFDYK